MRTSSTCSENESGGHEWKQEEDIKRKMERCWRHTWKHEDGAKR